MKRTQSNTEDGIKKDCRIQVKESRPCLQKCFTNGNHEYFVTHIDNKNKRIRKGETPKHVGVRWDYAEWANTAFVKALDEGEAKLVFAMRDLKDVFLSLAHHNFLPGNLHEMMSKFVRDMTRSLDKVEKLNCCPVDCSEGMDLVRLLDWLKLSPTRLQIKWMFNPIVTNKSKLFPEDYTAYIRENSHKVKIPKDLHDRYWGFLEKARDGI